MRLNLNIVEVRFTIRGLRYGAHRGLIELLASSLLIFYVLAAF